MEWLFDKFDRSESRSTSGSPCIGCRDYHICGARYGFGRKPNCYVPIGEVMAYDEEEV
jgi:hypothetical protein